MPAKDLKPRYMLMRANGGIEYDTVAQAITAAQNAFEHEPAVTVLVVRKIATVAPQLKNTITRHYPS
jgi:hypothetical protein